MCSAAHAAGEEPSGTVCQRTGSRRQAHTVARDLPTIQARVPSCSSYCPSAYLIAQVWVPVPDTSAFRRTASAVPATGMMLLGSHTASLHVSLQSMASRVSGTAAGTQRDLRTLPFPQAGTPAAPDQRVCPCRYALKIQSEASACVHNSSAACCRTGVMAVPPGELYCRYYVG